MCEERKPRENEILNVVRNVVAVAQQFFGSSRANNRRKARS